MREGLAVPERFLGLPEEGLAITLDSTIASGLVEAVRFLELYPYDCLEQRTSKLFAYILYDWLADRPQHGAEGAGRPARLPDRRRRLQLLAGRGAPPLQLLRVGPHRAPAGPGGGARASRRRQGLDWEALIGFLESGYAKAEPALRPYALYVLASLRQGRARGSPARRHGSWKALAWPGAPCWR